MTVCFNILVPDETPKDWTLEIKTYPHDYKNHIAHFTLHYMDKDDTILMVGIEQRKEPYKNINLSYSEEVGINVHKGYFEAWGNSGELDKKGELITGGVLFWKQDGTYVTMHSSRIPKKMMLDIARSMKVVNLLQFY
jgi:hypothetical protein